MTMANVLNEFLHSVSKGFSDSAFANFQRRRSSVRDDIDREFTLSPDLEWKGDPFLKIQ